jgi:methoxymalonate biosynthesis acyl carrier protein
METDSGLVVTQDLALGEDLAKVRTFVTRALGHPVRDNESFFDGGLVSSLFGVQLLTFIEKSCAVEVTDEDLVLDNFASIESICRFVSRKRQCRQM